MASEDPGDDAEGHEVELVEEGDDEHGDDAASVASVDGTGVVINEAFLSGGSAGAAFNQKFVELYNPGDEPVEVDGWALHYRSATGTGSTTGVTALAGEIPAGGYYLVAGQSNGTNGEDLPTPDATGSINPSGTTGTIVLTSTTSLSETLPTGSVVDHPEVVDLLGYGTSNTFEGAPAAAPANNQNAPSFNRTDYVDTDDNAADFTLLAEITPTNSAGETGGTDPGEPGDPVELEIAEIQGTGPTSPYVGDAVVARGVVTAVYPTGGFNGFTFQTAGTGGEIDLDEHDASHGLFAYGDTSVAIGDYVEVTGEVAEFFGLTQVVVDEVEVLTEDAEAVDPAEIAFPTDDELREAFESMLVAPQGDYTVSDAYPTNQWAEIILAAGDTPLRIPTDVADPGTDAYAAAVADNAARRVLLDDGATTNYLSGDNRNIPIPWLSLSEPVRTGAAVTFNQPVVLDYRNNNWKFQPTTHLTVDNAAEVQPATFENTRPAAPADVGGAVSIAAFNVLNYFTTTGDELDGCTYWTDREDNPVTVSGGCLARGAADAENLERQEVKIVAALNALDADVVGLQEIEQSAPFGKDRDAALADLVEALNADAGAGTWAYAPSPSEVPEADDVIRTAFIYKPAAVELVGESQILLDSPAYGNAREPLAQAFRPVGGGEDETFLAVVNHFKSKGASGASGPDLDQGDGQGAYNAARVAQAEALVEFTDEVAADIGTDLVFLVGDFNSYSHEDPVKVFEAAGYVNQGTKSGKSTYVFGGEVGSLDHIFASAAADDTVTGADIWNINAGEAIALEYSRHNYNAVNLYDTSLYRSSDHDPVLVGFDPAGAVGPGDTVDIALLGFSDFHGRIDANTVKFAGTVEQLRAEAGDESSLVWIAGDNIGASLFASAVQQDQPTIDVLNALEVDVSAVGNHEFDQGFEDLTDRVIGPDDDRNALWDYLGANVYHTGTTDPALPEFALYEVAGLTVGVIGAVTEETPALVLPDGVAMLDFGDPVEAINRVAAQLTDGDESNGEADVLVATLHEGSPQRGGTLEDAIADSEVFASIVEGIVPEVVAILNGHTSGEYVFDAPVPGVDGATRPVMQVAEYGAAVGEIVLTVDAETGEVVDYTQRSVPRTTADDDDLVDTYPRVAEVASVVEAALEFADEVGAVVVGEATADITTAYLGGSYVDGVYVGPDPSDPEEGRDDRAAESTLGNLVADALLETLSDPDRGGADIGVVNPGGLRDELFAGDITYAQANAVLPFVNNLWTTTLTGAQVYELLEQQWQRDAAGNVPSRPYLQLGLSANVSYTFDADLPEGERVTSIWVDGEPVDLEAEYRIGSFNFLLQGGDNFHVFDDATDTADSGLVDRDAWIEYIEENSPLSPSFDRRAVQVAGAGAEVDQGDLLTLEVSGLDLTSLGSPQNTALSVAVEGSDATFDDVAVSDGAATVELVVPDDVVGDVAVLLTAEPSGTVVRVPVTVAEGVPAQVEINLLHVNDFHGRIDANTVKWAGTIEGLRAEHGDDSSLFLAAGDHIGASLFASAIAEDQPTIDVLNALDHHASAVGNHEFDQGFDDLTDRVIAPDGDRNALWEYLGANVYHTGTTDPALPEYALFEVEGVTVGVIGAVTQDTPSLVLPDGVAMLDFGDPVEAVNRVATQLTDGDESNGEADVIVATLHEGSPLSESAATVEEAVAAGGPFAEIVTGLVPEVDVIFNGHTNGLYAWDAPVPGLEGATRPVVQSGNYGAFVGQVVLTVDTVSGEVVDYTAENHARVGTDDDVLVDTYPRVAEVAAIVEAALEFAEEIGDVVVGEAAAHITTAFRDGAYVDGVYVGPGPDPTSGRDNRGAESTLGGLVANALLETLSDPVWGGAEIGVVNPGGLRAELFEGDITYAIANAVLPFGNELWTTTLTGEQLYLLLDQQWQTAEDGSVPATPYLQLGLSDNVSYTFDPDGEPGERITSIWVDGEPVDLEAEYRIGSFSFLIQGGDNFRVFWDATGTESSGLLDRDAWIDYITENSPLEPDFARRAVQVVGADAEVAVGETLSLEVSGLDLTSLGSPQNTALSVEFEGSEAVFDDVAVVDGAATVELVVPGDVEGGAVVLLTAAPSGTVVRVPVSVTADAGPVESTTSLVLTPAEVTKGQSTVAIAHVRADGEPATGAVTFWIGPQRLGTVQLSQGLAGVTVPGQFWPGKHLVKAVYHGTDEVTGSHASAWLRVTAAHHWWPWPGGWHKPPVFWNPWAPKPPVFKPPVAWHPWAGFGKPVVHKPALHKPWPGGWHKPLVAHKPWSAPHTPWWA